MIRRHHISVKNAIRGLTTALNSQPNYRIHLFLSAIALIGGILLRISYNEFLVIITLIFVGLTIETINTAIESTNDAIDMEWRKDIKVAKDASAGAMLIFALGALILSLIIYIPKIVNLFN